jgi:hypothetical protein
MRKFLVAGIGVCALTASAAAQDATFSCQRDNVVRNVMIVGTEGSGHVCEVRYQRTSEGGEPQLLWHAQSDPKFCATQADALVGRLQEAGWACTTQDGQSASAAMAEPKSVAVETQTPSGLTGAIQPAAPAPALAGAPKPASDGSMMQLRPTIH